MTLFRWLLFWLLLALAGALVAQLLVQDPGAVLIRLRGVEYRFTVVTGLVLLALAGVGLWLLWSLLSLPLRGWRRRRERRARARFGEGLLALHHGQYGRAQALLVQAAELPDQAVAAHLAAVRAADARGDAEAAATLLATLATAHPGAHAMLVAERALARNDAAAALQALDAPAAQPLPPRGLLLRAEALAALGRSGEAYGLLGTLRLQQALPATEFEALQVRLAAAALREAADPNMLADTWDALSPALRQTPAVVAAYAERAAALRWDEAASHSLEQALEARWDEALAALYGRLGIGRLEARRAQAEHWLSAHPSSPALLLTLACLARQAGQWPQAEALLHRALVQGAGSEAWEELGTGYAATGDEALARQCYANALRTLRGEAPIALPGRDLRQRIHDSAAIEERDEHGMPRLRE